MFLKTWQSLLWNRSHIFLRTSTSKNQNYTGKQRTSSHLVQILHFISQTYANLYDNSKFLRVRTLMVQAGPIEPKTIDKKSLDESYFKAPSKSAIKEESYAEAKRQLLKPSLKV